MKPFRYWRDPFCLLAQALYVVNRGALKPWSSSEFLHGYFNDLLLIPAALPWILWLHRKFDWRDHDGPPSALEIAAHCSLWAIICEFTGPRLFTYGTADSRDLLAYAAGAFIAWCWWHSSRASRPVPKPSCQLIDDKTCREPASASRSSIA